MVFAKDKVCLEKPKEIAESNNHDCNNSWERYIKLVGVEHLPYMKYRNGFRKRGHEEGGEGQSRELCSVGLS